MNEKIVALDIETENTGTDIINDNKRILSVQLFNHEINEIFHYDSKEKGLEKAKERLTSLLDEGFEFVGYNLVNFDIAMIDKFLGIKIPLSRIIEIGEMSKINEIRNQLNKKKVSLKEVCNEIGVKCEHKDILNSIAESFAKDEKITDLANKEGLRIANRRNWSVDWSREYALRMITGGMAILEAYNEFVKSGESPNSLFYQYAMGDVITEHELYLKLRAISENS